MNKTELLKHCRYYKEGDEDFSFSSFPSRAYFFWSAEKLATSIIGSDLELETLNEYKEAGEPGKAFFPRTMPRILLAAMFCLYCKRADVDFKQCAINFEEHFLPRHKALTVIYK